MISYLDPIRHLIPPTLIFFVVSGSHGETPKQIHERSREQSHEPTNRQPAIRFNQDVRPILSDKCFFCHGPDDDHRAADLRLDEQTAAHESVLVPGNPDESELMLRVLDEDPDVRMPPETSGKTLTKTEIEILRRWISEGGTYEPYWAYLPPRDVSVPAADVGIRPPTVAPDSGPIDRLVRSNIKRAARSTEPITPSPRASRRDQLRRLSFDLLGLPPNHDDIRRFESDPHPDAYQRQVDTLLASPAFGERFAEYWLDLVRFADTVGYHGDQTHNVAPYRDYVIDSINDNKPLDQFSREQLAGDLLENPTIEQRIASGYNRLLQTSHEGGVQPKEYIAIYSADRVRNFSAVWMAATVGCAQCHDHKYDPYTARDFYSLAAFFADVDDEMHFRNGTNANPTRRDPEIDVLSRTDRIRVEALERRLAQARESADRAETDRLQREIDAINSQRQTVMITKAIEPRVVRFLPRGNWLDDSGDVMQPRVPDFLGDIRPFANLAPGERATRLDLADWLFDVESGIGGLTARVFANRLWYLYTGRGISPSLDDFGGQGSPPTNPELLDHLANRLLENGWELKATVRGIVTSETYRQRIVLKGHRTAVDPYNDLASTQSGHRLPAETVRDAVLEIAGLLDHRIGGRSVRPYQPSGYYRHLNFPKRSYRADDGAMQWRRGVYTHWQRQFLQPMLKALDAPSREECTATRPRSNTPLEALALLNDPTFVVASKAFAAKILRETSQQPGPIDPGDSKGMIEERIHAAMRMAIGRDADATEIEVLAKLLRQESLRFGTDSKALAEFLSDDRIDAGWPERSTDVQRAAWSSVARAVLNLHETLYRP